MGIQGNEEEIQGWFRSLPKLEQSWAGAPPWLSGHVGQIHGPCGGIY